MRGRRNSRNTALPDTAGTALPGTAETSAAVCCRNHFGSLVAVHEPSLLWGPTNKGASGQTASDVGGRRIRGGTCLGGNEVFGA